MGINQSNHSTLEDPEEKTPVTETGPKLTPNEAKLASELIKGEDLDNAYDPDNSAHEDLINKLADIAAQHDKP